MVELKIEERLWLGIPRHDLVYVTATLTYRGATVEIPDVLVDTGAASTVINANLAADAGIYLQPSDQLRRLRGVGGHRRRRARACAGGAAARASRSRHNKSNLDQRLLVDNILIEKP